MLIQHTSLRIQDGLSFALIRQVSVAIVAIMLAAAVPANALELRSAKVATLKNGEYPSALLKGIHGARARIILCCYLFKTSGASRSIPLGIADELIRAHQRGVEVTVILERSQDTDDDLNRENHRTALYLSRRGINVRFDSMRKTTHSKVAIIDGRYVYLGSHNLTQSGLTRNNELSVLIDSTEMAKEVEDCLERL